MSLNGLPVCVNKLIENGDFSEMLAWQTLKFILVIVKFFFHILDSVITFNVIIEKLKFVMSVTSRGFVFCCYIYRYVSNPLILGEHSICKRYVPTNLFNKI